MKKILIARGCSKPRYGSISAKQYPYWDELVSLLTGFEVIEVNEIPIPELEKLILNCDSWIALDSFFQHFAWSIGKKGIVLWGISDPLIFGHKENINIIKDRSYIRKDVFGPWDNIPVNLDAWVTPREVVEALQIACKMV